MDEVSILIEETKRFFNESKTKFEKNHTLEHSLVVLRHLDKCLIYEPDILKDKEKVLSLRCAAVLHDVDDKKFFPNNHNYENARNILFQMVNQKIFLNVNLIIKIIEKVSFTDNGIYEEDDISSSSSSPSPSESRWMLLVRYCDRLESIGTPGILRTYTYSLFSKRPLYLRTTPSPKTHEEIHSYMTKERYQKYLETKKSDSMMDHFFDKVLFVCDDLVNKTNPYILKEAISRSNITYNFVLDFGISKKTFRENIKKLSKM